MIFVTVGTHEQPFDRLLKCLDEMVENGQINEEIICQKGYTTYEPRNFVAYKLISFEELNVNINKARIVITHGGPASFIMPLSIGKIPIVFPRKKEFNEHVNDHQLEFAKQVEKRMKNIIVTENKSELIDSINNYDDKSNKLNKSNSSNNEKFCYELEKEITKLFK